jgi:hypothetical protein
MDMMMMQAMGNPLAMGAMLAGGAPQGPDMGPGGAPGALPGGAVVSMPVTLPDGSSVMAGAAQFVTGGWLQRVACWRILRTWPGQLQL